MISHTTSTTGMAKTRPRVAAKISKTTQSQPVCRRGSARWRVRQTIVAPICLPRNVKGVAEDRNRPHEHADAEVHRHADQRHVGHTANPCSERNHQRGQPCQHVTDARNQAYECIQAEADVGSGNREGLVEQDLELAQRLVAEDSRAAIPAV